MPIFRKRSRRNFYIINTASLPDLIFTVLFFFMMSTHMRDDNRRLIYDEPRGSELAVFSKKPWMMNLYIGMPQDADNLNSGKRILMQLNDKYVAPEEIEDYVLLYGSSLSPENRDNLTVVIKADKNIPMSVISNVRNSLRKANVRKIIFSALKENNKLIQN